VNRFFHRDDRRWEIRWVGERNGGYAPKGIPQIVPTVQPVGLFYWGDHDLVEKMHSQAFRYCSYPVGLLLDTRLDVGQLANIF